MSDRANRDRMPSYRFGKMVQYGGEKEPTFRPIDQILHDATMEAFRDLYFTDRAEAESALSDYKREMSLGAERAKDFISQTDPALAKRMENRECSFEDSQLPHYKEVQEAVDIISKWNCTKDMKVGEWGEHPYVSRLNTLLSDDSEAGHKKVKELDEKMDYFGWCEIGWSCMGRTRAEWQSVCDAEWIKANRPDWKVENLGGTVHVTAVR